MKSGYPKLKDIGLAMVLVLALYGLWSLVADIIAWMNP
jgi:hypothetical protein